MSHGWKLGSTAPLLDGFSVGTVVQKVGFSDAESSETRVAEKETRPAYTPIVQMLLT